MPDFVGHHASSASSVLASNRSGASNPSASCTLSTRSIPKAIRFKSPIARNCGAILRSKLHINPSIFFLHSRTPSRVEWRSCSVAFARSLLFTPKGFSHSHYSSPTSHIPPSLYFSYRPGEALIAKKGASPQPLKSQRQHGLRLCFAPLVSRVRTHAL